MDDRSAGEGAWLGLSQYQPREAFRQFHIRTQRWAAMVCHRRAGKTVACVADLVCSAKFSKKQDARFAYVAPQYNQAKDIAWLYLKRLTADQDVEYNESELRVDFKHNGARVRLYGADNADRMRGLYLDGCILDEFADMRPSVWGLVIRPMLMDRAGWAAFIGTVRGRNEFWKIYTAAASDPQWFSLLLKASDSGILSAAEIEEVGRQLTPEQREQELECSPDAAITGAYFGKELADARREGRICEVPYDPAVPVYTAWDLGKGANMAVWMFQVVGKEIHVIDHLEGEHSDGIPQIDRKLRAKPYPIAADWVPHDARATEIGTGRTRIETMVKVCGRNPRLVPDHKVMDGVNAARLCLPNCYFDADACAGGLEALTQYQAEYDEKLRTYKDNPRADWTSHTADAFRYLAMAWREMVKPPEKKKEPMRGVENITVDELWKLQKRKDARIVF